MAIIRNVNKNCAICNYEYHYQEINDVDSFGMRDLDTRPPGMLRSMQHLMLQKCPNCGYVSEDVAKNTEKIKKEDLAITSYQEILNDKALNFAVKKFILRGELLKDKNSVKAGMAYLRAAWLADDAKNYQMSQKMRSKAIKYLELSLEEENNENIRLIIVDMYRRIGMFDEAKEYAEFILENFGLEKYKVNILKYQIELCEKEDVFDHTIPGNYRF